MKVSVCIAAFNKPTHLASTLESICRQRPGFEFEVIVVDDGSKDMEVSKVCARFDGVKCLRIDREPSFRNPGPARNLAYRNAAGEVLVCQSDEVVHQSTDCLRNLVNAVSENTFTIATVYNREKNGAVTSQFTGPKRQKPYFFLGAVMRKHVYEIGGNDEDFAGGTGYEDAWFSDCLINGLGLTPVYLRNAVGHHLWHSNYNTKDTDEPNRLLYISKLERASAGDIPWKSSSGSWIDGDVFTEIYRTNAWGGEESVSGVGSSTDSTSVIRVEIPRLIEKYGIKSVLDLGCGDCNWVFRAIPPGVSYTGIDVVKELIESNKAKYPDSEFVCQSTLDQQLPAVDLVLLRDCLVHHSQDNVRNILRGVYWSKSKYLLTTTFPKHENRSIKTGSWTPINLQSRPYDLPEPLELINEDCRESYPHFNDKSLGLWRVEDMYMPAMDASCITVCVGYADKLAVTLPKNKIHFSRTLVVTSSDDTDTQDLVTKERCELLVTDAFYLYGAKFNKGRAIEEGFDALGRRGWFCVLDADILLPSRFLDSKFDENNLYVPARRLLDWPSQSLDTPAHELRCPTRPHEFDGYCQLFHSSALKDKPWYSIDWTHAGGCDSDFEFKFDEDHRCRLPVDVVHLGLEGRDRIGDNWMGVGNSSLMTQMRSDRKRHGTTNERITPTLKPVAVERPSLWDCKLAKHIAFFWQGPMSWLRYLTLYSFRYHNPSWRIDLYVSGGSIHDKTWTTHELDDRAYRGVNYLDRVADLGVNVISLDARSMPPAHACDLFQWDWLGSNSGFYADMDILWLKPMDDLLRRVGDSDAVFCLEDSFLAIGFFGSSGCRLFSDILNGCKSVSSSGGYQVYGVDAVHRLAGTYQYRRKAKGGFRAMKAIRGKYSDLVITEVPKQTVYPFDWRQINAIFNENRPVPDDAVGMHWFGGSEIAQRWNGLLTPDNWYKYLSTMTKAIGAMT